MNIAWDTFCEKLDLNNEQTIIIKYLINRLKDRFAEICGTETVDYELSPIEYLADLTENDKEPDEESRNKKFSEYFTNEKELSSGLTYFLFFQRACLSTHNEVIKLLNDEQKEQVSDLNIDNVFDVDTGYSPVPERLSRQIEMNKKIKKENSDTFCSIPFEYAYIDNTGDVYPCCPSKFKLSIGDLSKEPLQEVWKSKAAKAVRNSIINRTFRFCDYEACEYLKEGGVKQKEHIVAEENKDISLDSVDTIPKFLNLAYDRSCNLSCPTCRNSMYSSRNDDTERTARIHNNVFNKGLQGLHRLIVSGNGDPFASKFYMDFLKTFDSSKNPDARIKLQTNGLLFTPDKWGSIHKSHGAIDWISVSIDAATKETYEVNRGGSFNKLLENLEFISELRKSGKIKLFFINFVVQKNNYREMKSFIELGLKLECDLIEFQCIENWGTYSPSDFLEVAVHDKSHPEHEGFVNVMNDPIFANPSVCTNKLLEFLPDYIRKWIGQGTLIRYDDFGRHVKL